MEKEPRSFDTENRRYCDKGSHLLRSVFNRALKKAERKGLVKSDLTLTTQNITIYQREKDEEELSLADD